MLYDISIIMPTFNSESTIEKALLSIRKQRFDQARIELIVIDGGSNDKTLEIARKYGAVILENSKRLPEFAKLKVSCIYNQNGLAYKEQYFSKRGGWVCCKNIYK